MNIVEARTLTLEEERAAIGNALVDSGSLSLFSKDHNGAGTDVIHPTFGDNDGAADTAAKNLNTWHNGKQSRIGEILDARESAELVDFTKTPDRSIPEDKPTLLRRMFGYR